MIHTEILDNGKFIRHYTDDSTMELLQEDTGDRYTEAVDLYPTSHTYREVTPVDPYEPTEEDRLRAENAQMREALNTLGVQTE